MLKTTLFQQQASSQVHEKLLCLSLSFISLPRTISLSGLSSGRFPLKFCLQFLLLDRHQSFDHSISLVNLFELWSWVIYWPESRITEVPMKLLPWSSPWERSKTQEVYWKKCLKSFLSCCLSCCPSYCPSWRVHFRKSFTATWCFH